MSELTIKKSSNSPKDKDTIRIKDGKLNISVLVHSGKQGDFYISYCPSLNISGYGKTIEDAEDFLEVEMRVFCEDLFEMASDERENFLLSLGFKKEKFKNKNFSKAYVDEDGKLRDFEEGTLERKILEVA